MLSTDAAADGGNLGTSLINALEMVKEELRVRLQPFPNIHMYSVSQQICRKLINCFSLV